MTSRENFARDQLHRWFTHEIPRLFNYISYWVSDTATAQDITSGVCERALTHLHQFDDRRGTLDAWIFGIARNWIRTHYRQMRHVTLVPLDFLLETRSDGSLEENYADQERFRLIIQHLDLLSAQEREAVALRYGAGWQNTEIAALMGVSTDHVGVLLHRALKKLRRALYAVGETEQ